MQKKVGSLGRESESVEVESKPGDGSRHHPPVMPGGLNVSLTLSISVRQKIMGCRNRPQSLETSISGEGIYAIWQKLISYSRSWFLNLSIVFAACMHLFIRSFLKYFQVILQISMLGLWHLNDLNLHASGHQTVKDILITWWIAA